MRLFLSEDAPFQVSLGAQDHLQAKTSWLSSPSAGPGSDDTLPPGFEAPQDSSQNQIQLSGIPVIRWRCPKRVGSKFQLDLSFVGFDFLWSNLFICFPLLDFNRLCSIMHGEWWLGKKVRRQRFKARGI